MTCPARWRDRSTKKTHERPRKQPGLFFYSNAMTPYYQDSFVTLYHADCTHVLPHLEQQDLLLTDPPYGINENSRRVASRGKLAKTRDYGDFDWDKSTVAQWIIDQAIAKAKHSIIFGGNYYNLPPSRCWLVWDKENGNNDFADCELAWSNLPSSVRRLKHLWNGMLRKGGEDRFHPTQKPHDVMSWAIGIAGEGVTTILDPFAGSGTTLLAAKLRNIKSIGIEREERYCEIMAGRLSQGVLDFSLS